MNASEKKMIRKITRAIKDFWMINENETVLVWISGWKDSMVLGYLLAKYKNIIKEKFVIKLVYISKDFLWGDVIWFEEKRTFFKTNFDLELKKVEINLPDDSELKAWLWTNCQRCAYARRIALMKTCQNLWATKIVLGHHMDDIVVTTMINMIEWRKLKIMPPINKMKKWDITFIRPLAYLREKEILNFAKLKDIPFSDYKCPIWENTMRNKIKKQIIRENEKIFPKYTENIFWALLRDFKEKYEKIGYNM